MNHEVQKGNLSCGTCGAHVGELRRGRCWGCYARWAADRPVGLGATCAVCEERRRDNLALVEVQGRSLPLCHLCAARVGKLATVPHSVEGLRAALRRDRRQVERREGGDDSRPHAAERRAAQRRSDDQRSGVFGEDLAAIGYDGLDLDLDLLADGDAAEVDVEDADIIEATVVAEAPRKSAADVSPDLG
jgi:hypothetical protein